MPSTAEQYIVDSKGKPVGVLLTLTRYKKMLAAMEELDEIKAYDKAKRRKAQTKFLPLDDFLEATERQRTRK